jgi:hypothetical protein
VKIPPERVVSGYLREISSRDDAVDDEELEAARER